MKSIRGRDFLTLQDYSTDEIWLLLKTAHQFKQQASLGDLRELLRGKILAMIFQKPSIRTRVSFSVAMRQLGGSAINLNWMEIHLGYGEPISDTARVLNRYVDAVMARVYAHSDLEEMAGYADIPVINGLSDLCHPCQVLSDLLTIWEKIGKLKGLKLTYIGDGNNVCNSLLVGCTKMGVDISIACPKGYEPNEKFLEWAEENGRRSGSNITIGRDPVEAARDADVIYTDTFVSMGLEKEREKRLKTFLPRYQVNLDLFKHAKRNALFMHCLPAHRGEEVTGEVLEGSMSIVWDQAENRLHGEKAILALLL